MFTDPIKAEELLRKINGLLIDPVTPPAQYTSLESAIL